MLRIRTLEWSTAIERDYRRESKTYDKKKLDDLLADVLGDLMTDHLLPAKYKDHKLTGNWKEYRSCHVKPDLILIYEKPDDEFLSLVRLGSHSEIYGK